jgi:hypothetical protein
MNQTMLSQTDPDRCIYLHEEYEVGYWTKELGVSKEQLLKAVQQAGTGSTAVKAFLGIH